MGIRHRQFARLATLLAVPWLTAGAAEGGGAKVALDSWVYPALDRLAAMGFVPSQVSGQRPWSRRECARQVREAAQWLDRRDDVATELASGLIEALEREFAGEGAVVLESAYVRAGVLAGAVLNDSFHTGQSWRDDFGRPFGRGMNRVAGVTARLEHGPLFGRMRLEYQGAPGGPVYDEPVRATLARLDLNPLEAVQPRPAVDRARLVEGELGIEWRGWSVSAGRQALNWSPGEQSSLMFGVNAEPALNAKLESPALRLPAGLGTMRATFVMGRLGGHALHLAAVVQRSEGVVQAD